jgi:hypothetical protein
VEVRAIVEKRESGWTIETRWKYFGCDRSRMMARVEALSLVEP